jgi:hypothetical protein
MNFLEFQIITFNFFQNFIYYIYQKKGEARFECFEIMVINDKRI